MDAEVSTSVSHCSKVSFMSFFSFMKPPTLYTARATPATVAMYPVTAASMYSIGLETGMKYMSSPVPVTAPICHHFASWPRPCLVSTVSMLSTSASPLVWKEVSKKPPPRSLRNIFTTTGCVRPRSDQKE